MSSRTLRSRGSSLRRSRRLAASDSDQMLLFMSSENADLLSTGSSDYDYAPTMMYDAIEGIFKMWFGAPNHAEAGDAIYLATRSDPSEAWQVVDTPVFVAGSASFDSLHVNDPSVIEADDGTFYMYYSGGDIDSDSAAQGTWNRVGMTTSTDRGRTWSAGVEIISPANPSQSSYGAGQPSATYNSLNGYYYIVYTDTTSTDKTTGGGLIAQRSLRPDFSSADSSTTYIGLISAEAWGLGAAADWAYDPTTDVFVVATRDGESSGAVFLRGISLDSSGTVFSDIAGFDQDTGVIYEEQSGILKTSRGFYTAFEDGTVEIAGPVYDSSKVARSDNIADRPGDSNPYQWSIQTNRVTAPSQISLSPPSSSSAPSPTSSFAASPAVSTSSPSASAEIVASESPLADGSSSSSPSPSVDVVLSTDASSPPPPPPTSTCVDVATPDDYPCASRVTLGQCSDAWLIEGNYCAASCGHCS